MPLAYSYLRMSSAEQLKGDSLRRQLQRSRAYAEAHGLTLDESLRDLGVSAFRGKNRAVGALASFLRLVEDGSVPRGSALLVESLDRLSRETPLDALQPFLALVNAGVRIVTLVDGQSYDRERLVREPWGLLGSLMVMMRANEESVMKSDRSGQAWRNKQDHAKTMKVTARCPGWLRLSQDRTRFEIIPEKAQVVRDIYTWTAEGIGRHAVVRLLHRRGVRSLGGTRWYAASVARLLKDDSVLGVYCPGTIRGGKRRPTGERIEGYYPAIVTAELAGRARAAMGARVGTGGRRGETYNNLFHGLVHCACGEPMRLRNRGRKRRRGQGGLFLKCRAACEGEACQHRRDFNYEKLEKAFLRVISEIDFSRLDRDQSERYREVAERLAETEAAMATDQRRIRNLIEAAKEMDPAPRMVMQEIAALEQEVHRRIADKVRHEQAMERIRREGATDHAAEIERFAAKMGDQSGDELYRTRAALAAEIRRVVKRMTFDGGEQKVTIVMNGSLLKAYFFLRDFVMPITRTRIGSMEIGPVPPKDNISRVEGWCHRCYEPFDGSNGNLTCPVCGTEDADRIIWQVEADQAVR
jgi:DNA invertase Pin-like site-specific DNA recombinase